MSNSKQNSQVNRRNPLTLNSGTKPASSLLKQQPVMSENTNKGIVDSKAVTPNRKLGQQQQVATQEMKDVMQKDARKLTNLEKRVQCNAKTSSVTGGGGGSAKRAEKADEKRSQNDVGSVNGSHAEKQHNGKEMLGEKEREKQKQGRPEVVEKQPVVVIDRTVKCDKEKKPEDFIDVDEKKKPSQHNAGCSGATPMENTKSKDISVVASGQKSDDKKKEVEDNSKTPGHAKGTLEERGLESADMDKSGCGLPMSTSNEADGNNKESAVETMTATVSKQPVTKELHSIESAADLSGANTTTGDSEMREDTPRKPPQSRRPLDETPITMVATATKATVSPVRCKWSARKADGEERANESVGIVPLDRSNCPRTFLQISGRRSIRPLEECGPSFLHSQQYWRDPYRKSDADLDSSANTSLNVTVGSEVMNNSSFSFFRRGNKRERTQTPVGSTMELQMDLEASPKSPKRSRVDVLGILSAVSSPLTLLRSRFTKASIQSSTPVKLQPQPDGEEDESEVQNVSGVAIEFEKATDDDCVEITPLPMEKGAAEIVDRTFVETTAEGVVDDCTSRKIDEVPGQDKSDALKGDCDRAVAFANEPQQQTKTSRCRMM